MGNEVKRVNLLRHKRLGSPVHVFAALSKGGNFTNALQLRPVEGDE